MVERTNPHKHALCSPRVHTPIYSFSPLHQPHTTQSPISLPSSRPMHCSFLRGLSRTTKNPCFLPLRLGIYLFIFQPMPLLTSDYCSVFLLECKLQNHRHTDDFICTTTQTYNSAGNIPRTEQIFVKLKKKKRNMKAAKYRFTFVKVIFIKLFLCFFLNPDTTQIIKTLSYLFTNKLHNTITKCYYSILNPLKHPVSS